MPAARLRQFACVVLALCVTSSAQGPKTKANSDQWEEINFAFASNVVVDGFPSLLRLTELLKQNPAFRVRVVGYTDVTGSVDANKALAGARAESVKAYLLANGAKAEQVAAESRGVQDPVADNATKEGRYMNRRVVLIVMDDKGKVIGPGSLGQRLRQIGNAAPPAEQPEPPARAVDVSAADGGSKPSFAVQVGTFRDPKNAAKKSDQMRRLQLPAQIFPYGDEPLWRVVVGCNADRSAATSLAERLKPEADDLMIVRIDCAAPPQGGGTAP